MDNLKIAIYVIIRTCMRIFCIFPVKRNRIFFESYAGRSYSCNPKYLCEYIMAHDQGKYQLVWAFRQPKQAEAPARVKKIKKNSIRYFYYHMTSKVIVTNMTDAVYIPLRKSQRSINTWHAGGAYKKVGLSYDKIQSKVSRWQNRSVCKETSYYLSSSDTFTKYNIKEAYGYEGEVVNFGMPRNDLFFDHEQIKKTSAKVREQLGIQDATVILFAPTFRGDFGSGTESTSPFPYEKVTSAFAKENRKVIILNRSHYVLADSKTPEGKNILNVNAYPDMQELLAASDILITDFSSSIWDFAFLQRPCVLYIPDVKEYQNERGTYTPIETWPGTAIYDEETLCNFLTNPPYEKCKEIANTSVSKFGSYENGKASEMLYNLVEEVCK